MPLNPNEVNGKQTVNIVQPTADNSHVLLWCAGVLESDTKADPTIFFVPLSLISTGTESAGFSGIKNIWMYYLFFSILIYIIYKNVLYLIDYLN